MLTLTKALEAGRLQEFIRQEEARGVQPIVREELDRALATVIRTPPQDDQTSGSPPDGGSPGK